MVVVTDIPPPRDAAELVTAPGQLPAGVDHAGPEYVERPSINELLDRAASCRICVVIGAAGWGKTSAVETWSRERPTAWVPYEEHDGDAGRLLSSLVAALQVHLPGPAPIEGIAAEQAPSGKSAAASICGWLRRFLRHDLVVVLDDLHGLLPGSEATDLVEALCQRAPARLHLVLISRCEVPFSLQRLRGRGLVTEIHAPDLAFDVADVEALLRKTVGKDPPGLSRQVWEYTGGWATAVHCVVEMLRAVGPEERLEAVGRLVRPGERFYGYLTEEVIGAAPAWIRQLLERLEIFGEVSSATEIARGIHDPTSVLAELSRQGLVRRSGGYRAGWSLVRPLRDYFEHSAGSSLSERSALHVRAATECLGRGARAEALRHLLAAGDHAGCASILIDHGPTMVASGHLEVVLEAAGLPEEYLDDPRIQRVLGHAQQVRGHLAQALDHFRRAGGDRDELEPALAWRVGVIAFTQGEFTEVQALLRRTRLERESTLDEVRMLALSASAYRMAGDLESLRATALRTRAAARQCADPRAWSSAHQVLMLLAAAEGDWLGVDAHCGDALRSAEMGNDLLQLTWIRACQALHQFEAGVPQQASADAQIALSLSERCENPFLIAHALTTRGRARARMGLLEAAAGDFATAIDLFQRLGSRLLAWPMCGLGDLHRTRGQLLRARAAYEEALALAEPYHDVFGISSASIGLARVTAADDLPQARVYAERAVALGEGLREVPALLTRGWVELVGGNRQSAAADAERAVVAARHRRDNPGLAEAITLTVLAAGDPGAASAPLREAIEIWQEMGCRLEEAATRVVAAHIGAPIANLDAYVADQLLLEHGVDVGSRRAAGPLRVLLQSAPAVSIQTLGVFQVFRDGAPIPNTAWQSKKARDLLKILVARRRPTPRDQLMDLLWPGVGPTVAGNRLSVLLSTVRDVLQPELVGEAPLITTDGAVSLNRSQVSIDVESFLTRAAGAFEADRAGAPDATGQLIAAVAAHTGDFLENDPYQEWAGTITEEVRAAHIALLRALTARLRDAGVTDEAVWYTLRLLEQDRYDEEAHRNLIEVLLEAGRLGEAHRHYQIYVRRMAEIDVRPSPLSQMTSRG